MPLVVHLLDDLHLPADLPLHVLLLFGEKGGCLVLMPEIIKDINTLSAQRKKEKN